MLKHLFVYYRPQCHLCETLELLLEKLGDDYRFDVTFIDITSDIDLFKAYRYQIPVVMLEDGSSEVYGQITEEDLRKMLAETSSSEANQAS